jgi:hypothetical protein
MASSKPGMVLSSSLPILASCQNFANWAVSNRVDNETKVLIGSSLVCAKKKMNANLKCRLIVNKRNELQAV